MAHIYPQLVGSKVTQGMGKMPRNSQGEYVGDVEGFPRQLEGVWEALESGRKDHCSSGQLTLFTFLPNDIFLHSFHYPTTP